MEMKRNFNALMIDISRALKQVETVTVRNLRCKELINFSFILQDPTNCICTLKDRKLDMEYLCAELLWYLSCDETTNIISVYASLWNSISNNGIVQSNYGISLFMNDGLKFMIDQLIEDKMSRKAVCPLNSELHRKNLNDLPCTMYLHLYIRNDYLNMKVTMRSNDLIYGLCYDIVFFSMVQQIAFLILKRFYPELKLGYYYHEADSLHVYEKHFNMADKITTAQLNGTPILLFEIDDAFLKDLAKPSNNSRLMKKLYEVSRYPGYGYHHEWIDRYLNI